MAIEVPVHGGNVYEMKNEPSFAKKCDRYKKKLAKVRHNLQRL